jgi:predicted Zn-dependent protease
MSHVALRHGTAQATKATKYEIGAMAGAVLGAIIGGNVGSVVAQGTQFGLGTAFLRFSREYERQADILGSHIMASVGYDPREMASMFKLIEKEGGSGGPQWLSDHPNPGDRSAYITREAQSLQIQHAVHDTRGFEQVQARLRRMAPAPTTEEATRSGAGRG